MLTSQVLTDTENWFPAGSGREIYWHQMCVHNDYLNTSLPHISYVQHSQDNVHVQLKKSGGMDNYSVKTVEYQGSVIDFETKKSVFNHQV